MLGKVLCERLGLPDTQVLNTYALTVKAGCLRARFTHDHASIKRGLPYGQLPTDKSKYRGKTVIFLTRNIKDVLVSSYFQATLREATDGLGMYAGSIAEFIRSERFGARKIATFYNIWHANRELPGQFLEVSYEDMHLDPAAVLSAALDAIGLAGVDAASLQRAVEFARFDHLKQLESQQYFNNPILSAVRPAKQDSFKLRRGLVGGYGAYLTGEDIQYIDGVIEAMGCPFGQGSAGS
jgi:hypothetical protein